MPGAGEEYFKLRRLNAGFGLIEMLVGTVLITTSSLALVGVIVHMSAQNQKAQTQSHALALQSEVIAALARGDSFASTSQQMAMTNLTNDGSNSTKASDVPGLVLKTQDGKTLAVSGQRIGLNMQNELCDPTKITCPFWVDLSVQCSAAFGCRAAYRVSVAQAASKVALAALGAPIRRGERQ